MSKTGRRIAGGARRTGLALGLAAAVAAAGVTAAFLGGALGGCVSLLWASPRPGSRGLGALLGDLETVALGGLVGAAVGGALALGVALRLAIAIARKAPRSAGRGAGALPDPGARWSDRPLAPGPTDAVQPPAARLREGGAP